MQNYIMQLLSLHACLPTGLPFFWEPRPTTDQPNTCNAGMYSIDECTGKTKKLYSRNLEEIQKRLT